MIVVLLDGFQVIIEMEFMHITKLAPMSFLNSLCLMRDDDPYMVLVFRGGTKDPQQISTLQLKEVVRKDELTFVAILKLEPLNVEVTHKLIMLVNVFEGVH